MRLKLGLVLFLVTVAGTAGANTVDFEIAGSQVCMFRDTLPLGSQYAPMGINFDGAGTVLNACANFAVTPHSGADLLAFHMFGYGTGQEVITFVEPVSLVSIWVTSTAGDDTFRLMDSNGLNATVVAQRSTWTQLSLKGTAITQVTLSEMGGRYLWLADDLTWTANLPTAPVESVPEPGMLGLLGGGFGLMGAVVRKLRN